MANKGQSKIFLIAGMSLLVLLGGYFLVNRSTPTNQAPDILKSEVKKTVRNIADPVAVLETTRGDIVIELFPEAAPQSTKAIINLIKEGFYTKKKFFNVAPGNYIMAGEPIGLETTYLELPIETSPYYTHRNKGTVAMYHPLRSKEAENQFYITLSPQPGRDGGYTVIGQVRNGLDVLDKIQKDDKIKRAYLLK